MLETERVLVVEDDVGAEVELLVDEELEIEFLVELLLPSI